MLDGVACEILPTTEDINISHAEGINFYWQYVLMPWKSSNTTMVCNLFAFLPISQQISHTRCVNQPIIQLNFFRKVILCGIYSIIQRAAREN